MRDSATVIEQRVANKKNKEVRRVVRSIQNEFEMETDENSSTENVAVRTPPAFPRSTTGQLLKQLDQSSPLGTSETIWERLQKIREECDFGRLTRHRLYGMLNSYGFNDEQITEAFRTLKMPDRKAKVGIRKRMQKGLYKPTPFHKESVDAELQKRLHLMTDKASTEFVLDLKVDSPSQHRDLLEAVRKHTKKHPKDRFIHPENALAGTPTSTGLPTRRLPKTPGGTVPKAILTATMPFGELYARPVNSKLSQGSVVECRNPNKIATVAFSFEVTPQTIEDRKGTKRPSQNSIVGMTATEKFTFALTVAGEDFLIKDCVRAEDGVLKFTDVDVDGVVVTHRDKKRDREEVMMHHAHTQGDGIGGPRFGPAAKENLTVGTPGSNFTLFAYLEAHIQTGKFFKDGHEVLRVTGDMDLYEAADGNVYWQIPLKTTYHVAWGNGRTFELPINPMVMNYPTYGCACLVGDLIELVRTPKKVRPEEQEQQPESPPTWEL